MADRFDEIAMSLCWLCRGRTSWRCNVCKKVAAALRDTDAKAREEERERCLAAVEKFRHRAETYGMECDDEEEVDFAMHAISSAQTIAAAIREGAGECGTCGGAGFVPDLSTAPPPPGVPPGTWFGARVATNKPCPACQGGDGAEVVCHMCGGTFPPCHECSTERGGFHA